MDLDTLRRSFLDARDQRAAAVACLVENHLRGPSSSSLVVVSLNIPGPDKNGPGIDALFDRATAALRAAFPEGRLLLERRDALGPWAAIDANQPPSAVKRACVVLEESVSGGRLLDLDVYDADGRQVDRAALGLPSRRCLACDRPASDCIRLNRHDPVDLAARVRALLA